MEEMYLQTFVTCRHPGAKTIALETEKLYFRMVLCIQFESAWREASVCFCLTLNIFISIVDCSCFHGKVSVYILQYPWSAEKEEVFVAVFPFHSAMPDSREIFQLDEASVFRRLTNKANIWLLSFPNMS